MVVFSRELDLISGGRVCCVCCMVERLKRSKGDEDDGSSGLEIKRERANGIKR